MAGQKVARLLARFFIGPQSVPPSPSSEPRVIPQGLLEFDPALPAEAAVPPAHEQVIGRKAGNVLPIAESTHLSDAGDPVDDTQNGELSNGMHQIPPVLGSISLFSWLFACCTSRQAVAGETRSFLAISRCVKP